MSHATFSLPHVFPSSSRPRHMNNSSAQPFQGHHISPSNLPQSTHLLASAAAPGAQRTLPYLLASRGSSSSSFNSRKYTPLGYSSSSSSSSFSTKPRGSSTRMVAPAAGTQLQAGQVGGAAAAGVMHRKSRATCTLSLAHVSASAFRPSVSTSTSTSSGAIPPAGSPSVASTADQGSDSGSDEGSIVVNEDTLDQSQTQALKDAVTDAPVHMWVGVNGPFPRVEVEVDAGNDMVPSEERMVFSEPEDVMSTKAVPIPIPSRQSIRTKKSQRSMAAKRKQSEVNIIPFPSSDTEASSSSFAGYMQERYGYTRERSGSISSSYSSTSSRSYSSSSSSGSSSGTSIASSSSSPPHALLRTSPPLSFKALAKRSRRTSNASIESVQQPPQAALSIDTSIATTTSSTSASAVVDDRDPPSPSSAVSASSSCTLIDSDDASDSNPVSPVKNDLKAKSTLALTMESTPPPPPYSLLPPPYSPLHSFAKGSDAKEATGTLQSPRPRRPLPEPPVDGPSLVTTTEVRVPEEATPVPAEVSVIHAPVPRAAFVRIEEGNEVPSVEGRGDKSSGGGSQPGGSVVSLPPISPPAQPPRVRTTSRSAASGSSATTPISRRSRISTGELKVLLCLYRTVVFGLESRYRLENERSPSPSLFMDQKASSPRFPLVEEDEESDKNTCTPHSSPSTSPSAPSHFPATRFNPSSCACPSPSPIPGSCSSPSMQAFKEARQQAKAKQAADNALDVQDALLAIRLRGLLRAQGVPEADLDLRVHSRTQLGGDKDPRSTIVVEDDGGAEDVDPFAEFGAVELDSASDSPDASPSSLPARPLKASPPPLSKSASRSGGKTAIAPSAAYMVALMTMRYRYASPSRRHRLPSGPRKHGAHAGGRKSKLNIAAWSANADGGIVEQEEADFDSCSVVDWYM